MEKDDAKKKLVTDVFSEGADSYVEAPFFPTFGTRLVELAGVAKGSRVLDIATGRGAVLFPAAERTGPEGQVTGTDLADAMVLATAADSKRRGLAHVDVRLMDAEKLTFPDSTFDFVLCGFGIMFLPALDQALQGMRRVVVPGGTLAVSTWAALGEINQRYRALLQAYSVAVPPLASQTLASSEELESTLQKAGFNDVCITTEALTEVFPTPEDWWLRATGGLFARLTNQLAPSQRDKLRVDAIAMLEEFKEPDGIHETRSAHFAIALSPSFAT